jgi:hypothetical protein
MSWFVSLLNRCGVGDLVSLAHQCIYPLDCWVPLAALLAGLSVARRITPSAMIAIFHSPAVLMRLLNGYLSRRQRASRAD